jgi:2'-5' RNA ligase
MFVAVVPPEGAIEHLDDFLSVRREAAPFRWVTPDHLHLTVAFLADVPDRAVDPLCERLVRAARKRVRVATRLAGGGAFPNAARARVLWARLDLDESGRTEVGRMAVGARAAAAKAGVVVDGQRFRPHVTLARLGRPEDVSRWVQLLDGYAGPPWTIDRLQLVASYLGEGPRGRPRYEVVESFPIGTPEAD